MTNKLFKQNYLMIYTDSAGIVYMTKCVFLKCKKIPNYNYLKNCIFKSVLFMFYYA